MHKIYLKTTCFFLSLAVLWIHPVFAQPEKDMDILEMYYDKDDILVTPTRYPKSISRIAENVSVITAEYIKAINAHTLTDVLNNIPGVQVVVRGGPGSLSDVLIQGSSGRHVLVMIDGVSQNSLSEGAADIGAIRVQNIERIEIVKGPASSVWGSSLGGVINIITKSPNDTRNFGGIVSASIGDKNTGDYRSEVSGTVGSLGYYLSGGGLTSDGLLPHNSFYGGDVYSKLELAATERANLTFTFSYNSGSRGIVEVPAIDASFDMDFAYLFSTLSLNCLLTDDLSLDLSLRSARREDKAFTNQQSTDQTVSEASNRDTIFGGGGRLIWTQKFHQLLLGVDFDLGELKSDSILNGRQDQNEWAIFANDTLTLGNFSLIPGLRYDYTSTNGDFVSPSLGATFTLGENTILRAYVARGFTIPPLSFTFGESPNFIGNPNLKMETVWSYSVGFETAALRYFWLKTMFFRHDLNDVLSTELLPGGLFTYINDGKQRRQGVEAEIRTMPIYNTSLMVGYAYVDAKDRDTGEEINGVARYTVDVGIQYDDRKSVQGTLKGHYIRWHVNPPETGSFNAMVWDFNLAKKVYNCADRTVALFFTAHNIFNSAQYAITPFKNPGRWFEGGIRFEF
jgi:vitamin B12 transporter